MTITLRSRAPRGLLCLVLAGCMDQGPRAPDTAPLRITVELVGIDLPPALTVLIDSTRMPPLTPGEGVVHVVPVGAHLVALEHLPRNCAVAGNNPQRVVLAANTAAELRFTVTCTAITGVVETHVAMQGLDMPSSYTLAFDTRAATSHALGETVTRWDVGGGAHAITAGFSPNCTVSGDNPTTVVVRTGGLTRDTARAGFAVTCGAAFGVVESVISVDGEDIDPSGFTIIAGGLSTPVVALPATVRTQLSPGQHAVELAGAATNCTVAGENPRVISISGGTATRDTVRTNFAVSCAAAEKIAFTRTDAFGRSLITVAYADGSDAVALAEGTDPSWSPDRTKILFTALHCYYYYYGCATAGLATVTTGGERIVQSVGRTASDMQGRWSPDGQRFALVRGADLVLLAADGLSESTIVRPGALSGLANAQEPAWSPDGSQLVFVCQFGEGSSALMELCVVNADGTQPTRLTTDAWRDGSPDWSPDGTTIAFHSDRSDDPNPGNMRITFMNPQGGDVSTLVEGHGPAWSGDGTRILFYQLAPQPGLYLVRRDGTQLTRLTTAADHAVTWRP